MRLPKTYRVRNGVTVAAVSLLPLGAGSACDHAKGPASIESLSDELQLQPAFPALTFERPVDFQHAGGDGDRVYVVEQRGVIHVFDNDPATSAASVFLDISERVSRDDNEEGLLGLAFHPDYPATASFYVYYSAASPRRSVLSRFSVDGAHPERALSDSEAILLEIPQPYGNHNGGQIAFGPDGYLYIGLGDGGSGGDPHGHGQDRTTLLGSILRIDVDAPSGGPPYSIPADNPFVGNTSGFREEIYAYGLRNPWRFSWDPETGRLWAGDVGQNAYEEIDVIEKGKNYGWNIMEGSHCFSPQTGCDRTGLELPIVDYPREQGVSVTGGFVYRGQQVPALAGKYVYADYGSGTVWTVSAIAEPGTGSPTVVLRTSLNISSFGVDRDGELYACAFDGKIYKFTK